MDLDDEICLCFHVTRRKVESFIRVEKPRRAGQLSECFGAGTGCGWCRPVLKRLFFEAERGGNRLLDAPSAEQYARLRQQYIQQQGDAPPAGDSPSDGTRHR